MDEDKDINREKWESHVETGRVRKMETEADI